MPFNPNYTQNAPFYIDNYSVVQVPMMFKEDSFYMMEDNQLRARVLKLPYQQGFSMLILLPDKNVDYTVIDDEITASRFRGWIQQLQEMWVFPFLLTWCDTSSFSSVNCKSKCVCYAFLMCSKLEVALPKWRMEHTYPLHSLLPDMGMRSVFSNTANLTKLSTDEGLMVSEVSFHLNSSFTRHSFRSST